MSDDDYVDDVDDSESIEVVDEGDPTTQPISVKCRAKRLFQLIPKLNHAQRCDAVRMGFGAMLELKFEKFPLEHVPLFFDAFKDGTYVFRASETKEFMVTKHDVHDCFQLPLGPEPLDLVPTGQMKGSNSPENKALKDCWRKKFGIKNTKGSIPVGLLKKAIEADNEGGDDFCRLFMLFCMSSFLAPTSNDGVDFKLLRAVENVSAINQLDWCTYVLTSIVNAGVDVRKRHIHLRGCIPFLMITYFQRFDFRGEICAHDLPLIKHWDEDRLKSRIKGEVGDGGLGRQTLSIVKYPRCIHSPASTLVTLKDDRQPLTGSTSCPQSGKRFIEIELPEGVEGDDQLKGRALDEVHEQYLMIQRNAVAFHAWYTNAISRIKNLTSNNVSPIALVPSQSTQSFWECAELHRYCDEVEGVAKRLKQSVTNAPALPLRTAMSDSKMEDEVATLAVNEVLADLKKVDMEVVASPSKGSLAVDLGNDDLKDATDGTVLDEIFSSGALYSTAEINVVLQRNREEPLAAELEVPPNEVPPNDTIEQSDRELLEEAGYTPAEVDQSFRKMEAGDTSEADITGIKTVQKRKPDDEPDSEITYKRRSTSTPDPRTPKANDAFVSAPVSEPLSAISSRRRGDGDGLGSSLDCGHATGIGLTVVSTFLRNNQSLFKDVPDLRKHVADYFFLDDNDYPNVEDAAFYGPNAILRREDIISMLPDRLTSSFVIECWAMLLNKLESEESSVPRMAFFGLRHTDVMMRMMDTPSQCTPGDKNYDMVFNVWDMFVKDCGSTINLGAGLIFIPISTDEHLACVCINFNAKSVDVLDNQRRTDPQNSDVWKAATILVSVMSDYLEYKGFAERGSQIPGFPQRHVIFDWSRPDANNEESGIFTMCHMLMYEGEPFTNPHLDSKTNRRILVIELAASLVLADMNTQRDEVLDKVHKFSAGIENLWAFIKAKRRIAKLLSKSAKSVPSTSTT